MKVCFRSGEAGKWQGPSFGYLPEGRQLVRAQTSICSTDRLLRLLVGRYGDHLCTEGRILYGRKLPSRSAWQKRPTHLPASLPILRQQTHLNDSNLACSTGSRGRALGGPCTAGSAFSGILSLGDQWNFPYPLDATHCSQQSGLSRDLRQLLPIHSSPDIVNLLELYFCRIHA